MSSSGYLVPRSQDEAQEKLWTETWKRIDRFLPDLRKEIDLEGPGVEENIKGKENEGLATNVKSDTEAGVEQEKTDIKV